MQKDSNTTRQKALETEQKALEVNLNDKIYGTFSEIGAGQEVARYFFQVGAAAGTIAKTMSAYDKVYSDKIYGVEASGRYVCQSRLYKMLDHEYDLMENRLQNERPDTNFFVFADTVSAINFTKTIKGNGWLGLRFQLTPQGETNDIVIHAKMKDNDNQLQQQAIGILGVNLVYGAYQYIDDPEVFIQSLLDNLRGRIEIDMIQMKGPQFESLDNRWLSMMLVKHGLSKVAMFGPDKQNIHASEFLYRKNVLIVRGSFRPVTLVNKDMLKVGYEQFLKDPEVDAKNSFMLTEITLDNLCKTGELDEKDFLDRADLLCSMGHTVVVSDCEEHQKLIKYLSDYKVQKIGMVIGVQNMLEVINKKYHQNMDGRLLAAFGELFHKNVKLYAYPAKLEGSGELLTCKNLPIPDGIKFLFQHLMENGQVVDVTGFNANNLHIFSSEVLEMIKENTEGWEKLVPPKIAELIKEQCLFGYPFKQKEFEY